jgi:dihydroxyacetone kinase
LLDASVCGNVFASPNVGQIRRGVELVSSGASSEDTNKGVLMIIMR